MLGEGDKKSIPKSGWPGGGVILLGRRGSRRHLGRMGQAIGWLLAGWLLVSSAGGADEPASSSVVAAAAATAPIIGKLAKPGFERVPASAPLAVTTSSEVAQSHVTAGLSLIHGGWDFEAYRHFCAALGEDPDCLMAYWGISLALPAEDPEYSPQQAAALERLLALAQAGIGTELERGYAFCLGSVFSAGPAAAAESFQLLAEKFPNESQARLFAAILGRSGYDEFNIPKPAQRRAEKALLDLLAQKPDDTQLLYAFLSIHAEAPDLADALERARKLVSLNPGFPPYQHLLGHYEFRCGNYAVAVEAFRQAIVGFSKALQESGVTEYDCPNLIKSRLYLATAQEAMGAGEEALATARELATAKIDPARSSSAGASLLLWEGKTLPARLLLGRSPNDGKTKPASLALAAMPPVAEIKALKNPPVAIIYFQALAVFLEARVAIDAGKLDRAAQLAAALDQTVARLAAAGALANGQNARSYWLRSLKAMAAHTAELRGLLAMAGPEGGRGSASNWYRAAIDKESRATLMMPPLKTYPMALRLGDFHASRIGRIDGELERAQAAYQEGLRAQPNNLGMLRAMEAAFTKAKEPQQAAEVARRLEQLQGPRK